MVQVVQIVLIACVTALAIIFMITRSQKSGRNSNGHDQMRLDTLEKEVRDLNNRLKNIETIVTSSSFDHEKEFEALREDG